MKKIFCILAVAFTIFLCGCSEKSAVNVGVVCTPNNQNLNIITKNDFYDFAEKNDISLSYRCTTQASVEKAVEIFCNDEKINSIVVYLKDNVNDLTLVNLAKNVNKPIIFYGAEPKKETLSVYDKCFYVGANPAYCGELMGSIAFNSFSDGHFLDKNSDLLLQYVNITDGTPIEVKKSTHTITTIEDNGLFTDCVADVAVGSKDEAYAKTLELLDNGINIELFVCTNASFSDGVLAALNERGLLGTFAVNESVSNDSSSQNNETESTTSSNITEDIPVSPLVTPQNYGVITADYTKNTKNYIQSENLCGTVIYNSMLGANITLSLAKNTAQSKIPLNNIEYPMNSNKSIYIPYFIFNKDNVNDFSFLN